MLLRLIGYVLWLPAVLGLGSVPLLYAARWIPPARHRTNLFFITMTGLGILGTLAIIFNFFTAVTPTISLLALVAGWLLFVLNIRHVVRRFLPEDFRLSPQSVGLMIIVLLFTALYTQKGIVQGDVGMYYLPTIKWIAEHRMPLGLANLLSTFGYDYLWFPAATILEVFPSQHLSTFMLNGLPLVIYGWMIWDAVGEGFKRPLQPSRLFLYASVVSLAILFFFSPKEVVGFTPNLPVALLAIYSAFVSLKALENQDEWEYYLFVSIVIAALAVFIKLTGVVLFLTPLLLIVYRYRRFALDVLRRLLIAGLPLALFIGVPWLVRGVSLSGCLAYPIVQSCIRSLDWTLPDAVVISDYRGIQSWTRQRFLPADTVLASWDWFPSWLQNEFLDEARVKIIVGLFPLGLVLWLVSLWKKPKDAQLNKPIFLMASLVPLVNCFFWFLTAPDIRYGYGSLIALDLVFICSGVYRLSTALPNLADRAIALSPRLGQLMLIAFALWTLAKIGYGVVKQDSELLLNWPPIPTVQTEAKFTEQGYKVSVPTDAGFCWNADLPCTYNFDPQLCVYLDGAGLETKFTASGSCSALR